ncbi:MAG: hypothetical protein HQL94_02170 [Magnetococcales bacterium]|nr:hypothetical protein [Magnetococcales bacterium]MBF0439259.1 hypothetical protein [Magnetococcales bacterium]
MLCNLKIKSFSFKYFYIFMIGLLAIILSMRPSKAEGATLAFKRICQSKPSCYLSIIARLHHAPFPYDGMVGDRNQPFFDHMDPKNGQRMHTTDSGTILSETSHYLDNRVLIHIPPKFNPKKPFYVLVFFHGHFTEIYSTLVEEMLLIKQINAVSHNIILVAPQMVLNAADSSPGKLYRPRGFTNMMGDVSRVLKKIMGQKFAKRFNKAPVILTAYSGGYRALAYTLDRGLPEDQIKRLYGVILLDALYGELDKFDTWLQRSDHGFLVNFYGPSSTPLSVELQQKLQERSQAWSQSLSKQLISRGIYFLSVPTSHHSIVLDGPPRWPLVYILNSIAKPTLK